LYVTTYFYKTLWKKTNRTNKQQNIGKIQIVNLGKIQIVNIGKIQIVNIGKMQIVNCSGL